MFRFLTILTINLLTFQLFASPLTKTHKQWMGLYLKGKKIGFSYLQIEPQKNGTEILERSSMSLLMLGQEKKLTTFTRLHVEKDLNLESFNFELLTGDQRMSIKGKVNRDSLVVHFGNPGKESSRKAFFIKKRVYLPAQLSAILSLGGAPPASFYILDPSTLTLEPATLSKKGMNTVEVHGKKEKAILYEMEYLGTTTKTWIKDGVVLKEESPMNLVAVSEPEKQATETPGQKVDLLFLFAVKPEGLKVNPSTLHSVKLRLTGLKTKNLDLDFANQKILKKGKGWAIVEYDLNAPKRQLKDPSFYLKSTPFMQVDSPLIKNEALRITAGAASPSQKVQKILDWVYSYLEKKPTVTLPSALEVMKSKRGDCNEHSVLFGALARSSGIPTVISVGLVYQNGAYYYHAWDAVYLKDRWVFVDPIFHEFPASPGHLLLKIGGIEKQAELVPVVGSLKIKILDEGP